MNKFIEVTVASPIPYYDEGGMPHISIVEEVELINLDNIAIITPSGNIILKRGYPNGDNVCKTKHTYEEFKRMLTNPINN